MALYLIGDVQGCDASLGHLLDRLAFSPSRDEIIILGDLVNRGPDSLATLRRVRSMEGSTRCLLGNHDLHLLAVAHGVRRPHRLDTLDELLSAPDAPELLDWLRRQPLALREQGWLLVHAGVLPSWSADQTLALAEEMHQVLRGPEFFTWLPRMYGNQPNRWDDRLQGIERLRVIVNALTRLRFCSPQGEMEFDAKGQVEQAPQGFLPWYEVPQRRTAHTPIAFGHWSALGARGPVRLSDHLLALDTGCVWGGRLTAARLEAPHAGETVARVTELIAQRCPQAQAIE